MAKRLATAVALTSPNGGTVTYQAGSTPPPEVAAKITNPDAWLSEDPADVPVVAPVLVRPDPPAQPVAQLGAVDPEGTPPPTGESGGGDTGGDAGLVPAQPSGGAGGDEPARNASTDTWRSYAEALGQTVPADAGRDAIIAQLVAAGLIKE